MQLLNGTLGRRIVGLMIIASAALSLISASFQLYISYQRDLNRVTTELDIVESSFLNGIERALWQFDFGQAEALVDGIFAQSDVTYVRMIAETGQTLIRGEEIQGPNVERFFELTHEKIDGELTSVGQLVVQVTLTEIRNRLRSQFFAILGSNFLKTLLASSLMLFIFDRMVAVHLRQVTDHLSGPHWLASENEIKLSRAKAKDPDEIDQIVSALNDGARQARSATLNAQIISRRLETVLNAATSGIFALEPNGRVLISNPRSRKMLSIDTPESTFDWPSEILFLDAETMAPLDASADPIRRILSGHVLRSETHLMTNTKDPENRRYVRIDSANLADENDEISAVIVIDDVSEQERTRQVVERRSRLDALGQLTGGIAHDFNNLLGSMLFAVDMAGDEKDKSERDELLQSAARSIANGRNLTTRLLAFAKKQPGTAQSAKVKTVFDDFVTLIKPMLEAKVALKVNVEDPELMVYCDQTQLETALMNLVLNSRDSIVRSGHGNSITLSARIIDEQAFRADKSDELHNGSEWDPDSDAFNYVEIAVTDDGPGMDEETRARATDPFFTTKDTNSGTGLGLSMVYGFVQQSGGDLRIYSEPALGTTIRMIMPVGSPSNQVEGMAPLEELYLGENQTVLLVEDEAELLQNMTRVLKKMGFQVITAISGNVAVDCVKDGAQFDLLLTDIVMPGNIGGFELARIVDEMLPGKPILFMSGYTGFSDAEMGEVKRPILQKPTTRAELSGAIRQAMTGNKGKTIN